MQNGQTTKGHELLQLRNDYREVREKLNIREEEIIDLKKSNIEKDNEIGKLRNQIKRLSLQSADVKMDSLTLMQNNDYIDNNKSNSTFNMHHFTNLNLNDYNSLEIVRDDFTKEETEEDIEVRSINSTTNNNSNKIVPIHHNCREVEKLKDELNMKKKDFEKEKMIWAQEKEKVLKYQRQLQMNYVHMYRKTKTLETEVGNLKKDLELDKKSLMKKNISNTELNQTIEL